MERKLKPTFERKSDYWLVGAKNPKTDYVGPVARVEYTDDWLYIVTDNYEGAAVLNIEALPMLLKALREITRKIKPPPADQ